MGNEKTRIRASTVKKPQRIALEDPLVAITDEVKGDLNMMGLSS